MLVMVLACNARSPVGDPASRLNLIPTPDQSRAQIIDRERPAGLTDPAASAAYDQGYSHMLDAAWFAAIAAYDEAIRIQPEITGLYEARGTAYMYAGRHDDALADYSLAIELDPDDAGLWRGRAAFTVGRQDAAGVAGSYSHQLGCLVQGHVLCCQAVEHMKSALFFWGQCHILHDVTLSLAS